MVAGKGDRKLITTSIHDGGSKSPRVGIVGAGISGLRCADILLDQGFQVTIFEARDRIGGRVGLYTDGPSVLTTLADRAIRYARVINWDILWICMWQL